MSERHPIGESLHRASASSGKALAESLRGIQQDQAETQPPEQLDQASAALHAMATEPLHAGEATGPSAEVVQILLSIRRMMEGLDPAKQEEVYYRSIRPVLDRKPDVAEAYAMWQAEQADNVTQLPDIATTPEEYPATAVD